MAPQGGQEHSVGAPLIGARPRDRSASQAGANQWRPYKIYANCSSPVPFSSGSGGVVRGGGVIT